MKKEKKFSNPEIEIIKFANEDIIVTSGDPWGDEYEQGSIGGGNVPQP